MSREQEDRPLGTADLLDGGGVTRDAQRQDAEATQREELAALFEPQAAQDFRARWTEVQTGFVDDPKQAVQHADELVAQVMQSLAKSFARQRADIEAGVGEGEASTENLRIALRRYRSFFDRLLTL
jgi:hypothetical protein